MTREVRYCVRCVISNQRPLASREYARLSGSEPDQMMIDAEGVCGACRVAERKAAIDWVERRQDLHRLCARHRRVDGRYDVLVPGSGGKDSVYAAHLLRDEFGLHPLTVTWAPHAYTDVGWRNFRAWLAAGFTNYLVTPNPRVHAALTREAFLRLLHPFQPFILGQRAMAPRLAATLGIGLVAYGEDDSEYEGTPHTLQWGRPAFYSGTDEIALGGVPLMELYAMGFQGADLALYLPLGIEAAAPITVMSLGYGIRWQPQEAYYFAAARGFEANEQRTEGTYSKYNSIDDKLDPLHYYTTYIKWGLGRASYDAAQEIRNGHLTREEGVALVRKYDGEIREETVAWACQYMGITTETFWSRIRQEQDARPWLWTPEGTLRHQVEP